MEGDSLKLFKVLKEEANQAGFPISGGVDLEWIQSEAKDQYQDHLNRYNQWIQSGFEGDMEYLRRGQERRQDLRNVFPETKSVFCVALPYTAQPQGEIEPQEGPRFARYLRGPDYHQEMKKKLKDVLQQTRERTGISLKGKVCVDTSAVLERTWAYFSGLGWIGKNSLLIHPQYGSYLLLGEILLDHPLNQKPKPLASYCGNCRRCLDACPTSAFDSNGVLDSRRCISYWTLEKRGSLDLSVSDQKSIKTWVAGCDICQEVCPFNQKSEKKSIEDRIPGALFKTKWDDLFKETQEEYQDRVRDSALNRVKPDQFIRNLKIAFSNR